MARSDQMHFRKTERFQKTPYDIPDKKVHDISFASILFQHESFDAARERAPNSVFCTKCLRPYLTFRLLTPRLSVNVGNGR